MHEAGLAGTFAAEVEQHGLQRARLRVYIPATEAHSPGFESAFRAHLQSVAPWYRQELLEVVVEPVERICASCVQRFLSAGVDPRCPACGGPPLPAAAGEVQYEVISREAGVDVP